MEMALSPSSTPASQISPWRSAPPQRTPRSSQRTATPRTTQKQKRRRQIRAAACRQWETHHVRRHLSSLWKIHTTLIAMPAQFSPQHSSLSISCTGFIISFCKCSFQAVESLISPTWSCSTSSFKIQHQSPWSEYERTWHSLFIEKSIGQDYALQQGPLLIVCKELAPSTSACKHGNAKPVLSTDQSIDQMRKSLEWIGCWTAPHSWLLCIVCMRPYTVWLCFAVQCEIKSLHQWLECVGAFYEKEIQSVLSNKLIKQELFGKIRDTFIIPSSGYENSKVQQATTGLVRKVLKWHLMISLKGKDRFLSLIAPLC